jgi:NADH-quinone oxidoreductase subunit F
MMENDLAIGSGAIVVMDYSVDIMLYLKKVMEFFVHESCGRCTPCRIGTMRILEHMECFLDGSAVEADILHLEQLITHITSLSACGLGKSAGTAIQSCLKHRRGDFESRIRELR